jgi:hypothetical protein
LDEHHRPMKLIPIIAALVAVAATHPVDAKSFPLTPVGLPFSPDSPKPVPPGHPLYRQVALDPVADMPDKVGKFLIPITSAKEMNQALRETLEQANMLAPPGAQAKTHLQVRWIALDAPQKISFSSHATARLSYTLVRSENGQQLFSRDISTFSQSRGGDASDRLKGNARLAIMTNLASAVVCLDKAAYERAPADCALQPQMNYRAADPPRVVVTYIRR